MQRLTTKQLDKKYQQCVFTVPRPPIDGIDPLAQGLHLTCAVCFRESFVSYRTLKFKVHWCRTDLPPDPPAYEPRSVDVTEVELMDGSKRFQIW